MRARSLIIATTIAVGLTAPVAATAAKSKADLELTKVTEPPGQVRAGGTFRVKVKINNRGERTGRGVIKMTLEGGKRPYALPRRIARIRARGIRPMTFKRYTIRLTVPLDQGAGTYRLRTCLKARGAEQCRRSGRVTVTAA